MSNRHQLLLCISVLIPLITTPTTTKWCSLRIWIRCESSTESHIFNLNICSLNYTKTWPKLWNYCSQSPVNCSASYHLLPVPHSPYPTSNARALPVCLWWLCACCFREHNRSMLLPLFSWNSHSESNASIIHDTDDKARQEAPHPV